MTVGSVIRYDVSTNSYVPSIANSPDSSEVIGVVESIQNSVYTVVASGLIKYPNITNVINRYGVGCTVSDGGTGGGEGGPGYRDWETDRKSTRLNSSHLKLSRMPSSA